MCPSMRMPLDESLYDAISHVLLAGSDPALIEGEASDIAWVYRWAPWPHDFADLVEAGLPSADHVRIAAYLCARRLHYAFAHQLLDSFTDAALAHIPGDGFLKVLNLAAKAALSSSETDWDSLLGTVMMAPSTKRVHIALSTTFAAEHAPPVAAEIALSLAQPLADKGDVVAAYRAVSFLRRLGRWDEAFIAVENATRILVVAAPDQEFGDHMSERLLVERHMVTTRNHSTVQGAHP